MASPAPTPATGPIVVLGAGYAGLKVAQELHRRSKGGVPVVLVDRHPVHVLRTELYEIGRLAGDPAAARPFAIPLDQLLKRPSITLRTGTVSAIDLDARTVRIGDETLPAAGLAICLGSVPAYYGVHGAPEHTFSVYRLTSAIRLGQALRARTTAKGDPARVVVIGGGSTGTEIAAEIATVDWARVAGAGSTPPTVTLVTGTLPFLAGLPGPLIAHARALLARAGVAMIEGVNAARVEPHAVVLRDGRVLAFDVCVWAAGVQVPELVRDLPAGHGHSGRVLVAPTLELPEYPGVFAVGDVSELVDPTTGVIVPATAQAAIAEAPVAAANLLARRAGRALVPFRYRNRGVIVSVGTRAASATVRDLPLWGAPAKVLMRAVEREYPISARRGAR